MTSRATKKPKPKKVRIRRVKLSHSEVLRVKAPKGAVPVAVIVGDAVEIVPAPIDKTWWQKIFG